jgi:PII-like signaling protein
MARHHSHPLYESIVLKARDMGLAGATVLRGPLGYGHSSRIHTAKILRLSDDLPVVIEIIDDPDKIQAFLPVLNDMMTSGIATLEDIQIISGARN